MPQPFITKEEFIKALDTVNAYTAQIRRIASEARNYSNLIEPKILNRPLLSYRSQFGARLLKALIANGIETVNDLVKMQPMDLYKIKGVGEQGYDKIKDFMRSMGVPWY